MGGRHEEGADHGVAGWAALPEPTRSAGGTRAPVTSGRPPSGGADRAAVEVPGGRARGLSTLAAQAADLLRESRSGRGAADPSRARQVWTRLRPWVWLREVHVWYEVVVGAGHAHFPMPPGYQLIRATYEQLPLISQLPEPDVAGGRVRMERGADLWLVLRSSTNAPVFRMWSFYDRAPAFVGLNGEVALPPDVVNLEDVMVSPDVRGLSLAPAAYTAVFDRLAAERGLTRVVCKVAEVNRSQRRAVEKVGWRPFARQTFVRRGTWTWCRIEPYGDAQGAWLAEALSR